MLILRSKEDGVHAVTIAICKDMIGTFPLVLSRSGFQPVISLLMNFNIRRIHLHQTWSIFELPCLINVRSEA
jgi:hypothetical protein